MGACASALGSGLADLEEVFDVLKLLGEGVEGKVYLCRHKVSNELVAVVGGSSAVPCSRPSGSQADPLPATAS